MRCLYLCKYKKKKRKTESGERKTLLFIEKNVRCSLLFAKNYSWKRNF